jgi:hypothetical protein
MPHKVFWLEPTNLDRIMLRRYHSTLYDASGHKVDDPANNCPNGYHDASAVFADSVERVEGNREYEGGSFSEVDHSDLMWPTHCSCGYAFTDEDKWQTNHNRLYQSGLDGKLYTLGEAPVGAMWDAHWYGSAGGWAAGPDGLHLVVRLPNGHDWCVDHEASNCTRTQWEERTEDGRTFRRWTGRTHYCWVRHGDPRTGDIHVDKNGDTCAAGAGSILAGNYHGFLHNGFLTD